MSAFDDLPAGWVVWNDEPEGRSVLVYRPDVFDGEAFPPACLPTISVSPRGPDQGRRVGETRDDSWYVACYLEPTVRVREYDARVASRAAAAEAAVGVAAAFARGEVEYRDAYQLPRGDYLDELDRLTGGGNGADGEEDPLDGDGSDGPGREA